MGESEPRETLAFVIQQLRAAVPDHEIEAQLVARGLDDVTAARWVQDVRRAVKLKRAQAAEARNTPERRMMIGGLVLAGGLAVTVFTWDGPVGIIAYGAIASGAAMFLLGWRDRTP